MECATSMHANITHIVTDERMGAIAYFECGSWNYWANLRRGEGGQKCEGCFRKPQQETKKKKEDLRHLGLKGRRGEHIQLGR